MIDPAPEIRPARQDALSLFGRGLRLALLVCCASGMVPAAAANGGFLQIRNGYFWDPATQDYFIPRGMAYQTFNPPVGANQSLEQLAYDLVEFKKMYCNSVRAEMVWNQVETSPGHFEWTQADFLVQKADELGLKLFVLIGFQYAPSWFPEEWKAVNSQGSNSVVLAYEHPEARRAYTNFIAHVTARYKNSAAIGAWILGNEYAYFDLWESSRSFLGFDSYSLASYRTFLSSKYAGNIAALNAVWATSYANFSVIPMPQSYPANRINPAYHDLIQWRKQSIGEYVAIGAKAARLSDPNHLRTYSMVGGLFGEADIHYTCEDAKTIVTRCALAGAPLDFWSINNYAIATLEGELRSADFGIAKHQAASGLPVLVSETGHSSTENLHPGAAERQAAALPTQLWEALLSGAMGVHIFTWNERDLFSLNYFPREKGFGIVQQTRRVREPVYSNVVETFRRMEQIRIGRLLGGTTNPPADIQFFWSRNADMGWPRANHENIRVWSAFKRLGYQPKIIHDEEFESGAWSNAPALFLSRAYQMDPVHLNTIVSNVISAGIHVHANADLPGQFDAYHKPNPKWAQYMSVLFGLGVTNASAAWDAGSITTDDLYRTVNFTGVRSLGPITNGYSDGLATWKIWHGLTTNSGTTIVTHRGIDNTQPPMPALHLNTPGAGKTAVNTFAMGDATRLFGQILSHTWDVRYDWLRAIYRNHFGMTPPLDISGTGASYIFPDYRFCTNGTVMIGLFNGHTNSASIALSAPGLLLGRTVESLTSGGVIETNSDGVLSLNLAGDQYVLLYAYGSSNGVDQSLLTSSPKKIWFENAPNAIWAGTNGADLTIGYDTQGGTANLRTTFERVLAPNKTYSSNSLASVTGKGTSLLHLSIPDADPNDVAYISSLDSGRYIFRAWLEVGGARVSEVTLPVRLLWGVHPTSPPPIAVTPGGTYPITLAWQELPSYEPSEMPTTLSRADLWEPLLGSLEYYDVVLELRANGQTVASSRYLTSTATDSHTFTIQVPTNAVGPFTWRAFLRPSPYASSDVNETWEGRATGAYTDLLALDPQAVSLLHPWVSYQYPSPPGVSPIWFDEGVQANGDGSQSMFMVVSNPPARLGYSGFGIVYTYSQNWALPSDFNQWTNYTFTCDFRELFGHACTLELQVKDDLGGQIAFTKTYTPGPFGWDTIVANLKQFTVTTNEPATGYFNQARVRQLVVNIQMHETNVTYEANFDTIRFNGPERFASFTTSHDIFDSFEDRPQGTDPAFLQPWGIPYSYTKPGCNSAMVLSNGFGIQSVASEGFRSAFVLVQNPANPADCYSGFGMYRDFPEPWALPASVTEWTNYVFSFDFKEANGYGCLVELQVKSAPDQWISYVKPYTGTNEWNIVRASLNQFTLPPGSAGFDPAHVTTIVLNIQMLKKDVIYFGSIDNVSFNTPDVPIPPDLRYGLYVSENDSPTDTDRDGIPDAYETGTGIYVSPTNTGTNPNKPDTDDDGLDDRLELIAGTNPNVGGDVFHIENIRRGTNGSVQLSWLARTNKVYGISYFDGNWFDGAQFFPLEGMNSFSVGTNGLFQAVDPSAAGVAQRFYRITVRNP